MDKRSLSRRFAKIMLLATGIYAVLLVVVAWLSSEFDKGGGFFEFDFPFYLLILALLSAPIYLTFINALSFIKEFIIYKSYGNRQRYMYCSVSSALWLLSSLMLPLSLHYSMIDKLLWPMLLCAAASVALYLIGMTKKNGK